MAFLNERRKKEKQTKGGRHLIGDHKISVPSVTARFEPEGSPTPQSTRFSASDPF